MMSLHEPTGPNIKCEVIQHLAAKHAISVILLQETHSTSDDKLKIYGLTVVGAIHHPKLGVATLVRNDLSLKLIETSKPDSATQWVSIAIDNITITNVYKLPKAVFNPPPKYHHPTIYSGDFNSYHTTWGCSANDINSVSLHDWTNDLDPKVLFNHKYPKTFYSAVWNTFTDPHLTFYSHDPNSQLPHLVHVIGDNFPKSQHQPAIIQHPSQSIIPGWDKTCQQLANAYAKAVTVNNNNLLLKTYLII